METAEKYRQRAEAADSAADGSNRRRGKTDAQISGPTMAAAGGDCGTGKKLWNGTLSRSEAATRANLRRELNNWLVTMRVRTPRRQCALPPGLLGSLPLPTF
jgi:hypothetical protein